MILSFLFYSFTDDADIERDMDMELVHDTLLYFMEYI